MFCWILVLILSNCKIPYYPSVNRSNTNLLVVEGFIDGAAPVTIKLSRTRIVSDRDTADRNVELGAIVQIQDNNQDIYPVPEVGNGVYSNPNILNLNPSFQYRLNIHTTDGKEYVSDYVSFEPSPPIDTIGWNFKDNGVQVYVNTHDPNNVTRYYRWEYRETWEFQSAYYTNLEWDVQLDTAVLRPENEEIHTCWNTDSSTDILLGSSVALANNVISEAPLIYIAQGDQKLTDSFSIFVKQYALDSIAYNYWTALQNNTESIGSIFDAQPNEIAGNLHCASDSEMVIGYIGAGNTVTKRVYISNSSFPAGLFIIQKCEEKQIPDDSAQCYFAAGCPSPYIYIPLSVGIGTYLGAFRECVDCTIYGTNVKPGFWP